MRSGQVFLWPQCKRDTLSVRVAKLVKGEPEATGSHLVPRGKNLPRIKKPRERQVTWEWEGLISDSGLQHGIQQRERDRHDFCHWPSRGLTGHTRRVQRAEVDFRRAKRGMWRIRKWWAGASQEDGGDTEQSTAGPLGACREFNTNTAYVAWPQTQSHVTLHFKIPHSELRQSVFRCEQCRSDESWLTMTTFNCVEAGPAELGAVLRMSLGLRAFSTFLPHNPQIFFSFPF